ncbi:hypothetical protein [Acetobacter persici]|uniref:hypothetical protein n=1 Tax=Acetobacter persici TaxID=1076596 RepID=UPI0012FE6D24|nr:hypothetical protein [Acetobacter persici]
MIKRILDRLIGRMGGKSLACVTDLSLLVPEETGRGSIEIQSDMASCTFPTQVTFPSSLKKRGIYPGLYKIHRNHSDPMSVGLMLLPASGPVAVKDNTSYSVLSLVPERKTDFARVTSTVSIEISEGQFSKILESLGTCSTIRICSPSKKQMPFFQRLNQVRLRARCNALHP